MKQDEVMALLKELVTATLVIAEQVTKIAEAMEKEMVEIEGKWTPTSFEYGEIDDE